MSIELQTPVDDLRSLQRQLMSSDLTHVFGRRLDLLVEDAIAAHQLHALINNPQTDEFLQATRIEAAHQRDRWGDAHDRGKSAENWFWLVGYLAGKCLRAVICGDKAKALHHTISSAAALANWYEAINRDASGSGIGHDDDIRPVEVSRFESDEQHPCYVGARDALLDEIADQRDQLIAGGGENDLTTVLGKALNWIEGVPATEPGDGGRPTAGLPLVRLAEDQYSGR